MHGHWHYKCEVEMMDVMGLHVSSLLVHAATDMDWIEGKCSTHTP